jgi:hypothetical protein
MENLLDHKMNWSSIRHSWPITFEHCKHNTNYNTEHVQQARNTKKYYHEK